MRKIVCLLSALVLLISLGASALAATSFVPSITFKDGPGMTWATFDGKDVSDCLVITTIKQATEKTTDITQDERDHLLDVYAKLKDGSMTLPISEDYVIRELLDVSYKYESCRQKPDTHGDKPAALKEPGKTLTVNFNMGISAGTELIVMTYIDGKWENIESVINNGDGTVTCVFEDICPVVFAVKESQSGPTPPQTGDETGKYLPLWIGTLALSGVALVTLVAVALKKKEQ